MSSETRTDIGDCYLATTNIILTIEEYKEIFGEEPTITKYDKQIYKRSKRK